MKKLATEAREGIKQLEMWGVPFIKQDGKIAVKGSPGHHRRRIVTVETSHLRSRYTTGLAISKPLLESVKESGVKLLNGILITRLLKKTGKFVEPVVWTEIPPMLGLLKRKPLF